MGSCPPGTNLVSLAIDCRNFWQWYNTHEHSATCNQLSHNANNISIVRQSWSNRGYSVISFEGVISLRPLTATAELIRRNIIAWFIQSSIYPVVSASSFLRPACPYVCLFIVIKLKWGLHVRVVSALGWDVTTKAAHWTMLGKRLWGIHLL